MYVVLDLCMSFYHLHIARQIHTKHIVSIPVLSIFAATRVQILHLYEKRVHFIHEQCLWSVSGPVSRKLKDN